MKKKFGVFILGLLTAYFASGQQISKSRLSALLTLADSPHSNAVIVWQDGKFIAEKYFNTSPDIKIEAMSCTKSIVGLAVACLLSDNSLPGLDVPVYQYYPEWRQGRKKISRSVK